MKIPSENELDRIRREYPVGTIIEIQKMDDPQAPPVGTLGEVIGVDDLGDLEMLWSTGSSLKVILSEDRIRKVNGAITICYGHREYWRSRKEAADYFLEGISASDGSECERYSKIYAELICGKTVCSDEYEDL